MWDWNHSLSSFLREHRLLLWRGEPPDEGAGLVVNTPAATGTHNDGPATATEVGGPRDAHASLTGVIVRFVPQGLGYFCGNPAGVLQIRHEKRRIRYSAHSSPESPSEPLPPRHSGGNGVDGLSGELCAEYLLLHFFFHVAGHCHCPRGTFWKCVAELENIISPIITDAAREW